MAIRLPNPPVERPTPNSEEAQEDQRQLGMWRNEIYRMCSFVGTVTDTPGTIAAGAVGELAISVVGVRTDKAQTVLIGSPSNVTAGLIWCGLINANDTVTVRIYNPTVNPITLASAEWSARVFP